MAEITETYPKGSEITFETTITTDNGTEEVFSVIDAEGNGIHPAEGDRFINSEGQTCRIESSDGYTVGVPAHIESGQKTVLIVQSDSIQARACKLAPDAVAAYNTFYESEVKPAQEQAARERQLRQTSVSPFGDLFLHDMDESSSISVGDYIQETETGIRFLVDESPEEGAVNLVTTVDGESVTFKNIDLASLQTFFEQ